MKITIKLSETNNALLNRVVKEEKVDASEFANSAFLDKFLPVSEKLGIEAGFILQEHEGGTLDAWLVKQCISRGIRWLGKHPIQDCAILKQILERFPFGAEDNGKISTCNECVRSEEHTSELQSPITISYAVFCLKKIFFNDTATTEIYTLSYTTLFRSGVFEPKLEIGAQVKKGDVAAVVDGKPMLCSIDRSEEHTSELQ